ncbi:MAG: low affinity iron permease family protein [Chitinophagaceae bacterium]|nr:low affinity iron permease family protein [Chitinophagaceae bacterium]
MKIIYRKAESLFEKFSMLATRMLGNSITFIVALILVFLYFTDKHVQDQPRDKTIMAIINSVTFLCIFIIQKSVNRFSAAVHLKINELVSAHENASNELVNIEEKSEEELKELATKYSKIASESLENIKAEENDAAG